jgi:hypothetical protein
MAFRTPFPGGTTSVTGGTFRTPFPGAVLKQPEPIVPVAPVKPAELTTSHFQLNPMEPTRKSLTSFEVPKLAQASSQKVPGLEDFGAFGEALKEFKVDPLSLKSKNLDVSPEGKMTLTKKGLNDAWSAIKEPIKAEWQNIKDSFSKESQSTLAGKYGADLKLISGAGNVVFSPISALFSIANDIPVLGSVSKLITLPFTALGQGATGAAMEIVDKLPISTKAKEQIAPGLGEVFALAAQLALGKYIDPIEKVTELSKKYGLRDAQTIVDKAHEIVAERKSVPVTESPKEIASFPTQQEAPQAFKTARRGSLPDIQPIEVRPETKIAELNVQIDSLHETIDNNPLKRLTKYESKSNPGELPEFGNEKGKFSARGDQIVQEVASALGHPEWGVAEVKDAYSQYADSRSKLAELRQQLKNTKGESFIDYTPEQLDRINSLAEAAVRGSKFEPVGTGKVRISGLASRVEESAVEKRLTKGFGDLPEYQQANMKEQASLATNLLAKDPERAKRIAMGEEAPPEGVIPESVFVAIENAAVKNGDVQTLRELATQSTLSTEATAMGQRIRTLAERDPESPIGAMADIKKAREAKVKDISKARKAEVGSIKESIRKSAPTKETWASFIDSIQC